MMHETEVGGAIALVLRITESNSRRNTLTVVCRIFLCGSAVSARVWANAGAARAVVWAVVLSGALPVGVPVPAFADSFATFDETSSI